MRVLATSDWHVDARTAGVDRLPDVERYISKVRSVAREEAPGLVLVGGDFFDPGRLRDCDNVALVMEYVRAFAEASGHCVVIAGNHDVVEAGGLEGPVTTLGPLAILAESFEPANLHVFEDPGVLLVRTWDDDAETSKETDVAILALPHVAACRDREGLDREAVEEFRTTLAANPGAVSIVLAHRTLEGARVGTESKEMARGRSHLLPDLAGVRVDLFVAGHYHIPQTVRVGGHDVRVVGSPFQTRFGEPGPRRGFLYFPKV